MKNFRLGFGPMSPEVINAIGTYATIRKYPLMIIASRNQVDSDGGYVMTTKQLAEQVKNFDRNYLKLCRDHCGPYFLDAEKDLSGVQAVEATKKTIAGDIEAGFDLIHIDTSRCLGTYHVAEELIKFCLDLNPNIKFEFGTEENVGVAAGVQKYRDDVKFASQFPNMEFVVAQTGSLVMEDRQAGTFNDAIVEELVGIANEAGIKLKEHNADYLTIEQIQQRRAVGVHALNIAPQLGVIQTKVLKQFAMRYGAESAWYEFVAEVLGSNKWKKWIVDGDSNKKVDIAGHYLFNHASYREVIRNTPTEWRDAVSTEIHTLINNYAENI